jgi:O-methyltransferase
MTARSLLSPRPAIRRIRRHVRLSRVSRQASDARLTYLSERSMRNLERCLDRVQREKVPGTFVEAGVALGGSAIVISTLMDDDRSFLGYDVFGMIPPPNENDDDDSIERYEVIRSGRSNGLGGDEYYGYKDDLYNEVVGSFESFGLTVDGERISLHQGLFEDMMRFDGQPVALAHLDCDWYDPVRTCLERIYPVLSPGGFVIVDDYHTYGGCARAVDEFLVEHADVVPLPDGDGPPVRGTNLLLRRNP